ncbi:MAG: GAK system ATP-grasp enzyme [Methylococcaceae bacterium]|nr:GAK system ATP-grasp enzyme [Methylococcaceae bacterium]
MDDVKIAVIGLPEKWSSEVLADAVFDKTGFRLIVDISQVILDLETQSLHYKEYNLCEFDALIVKKISATYSPNTLDRLELLRVAENAGVRVFSGAENILRLVDRLSCTVTLGNADIPMPPTRVTENMEKAIATVKEFGEAVFKPLYSTKARGMCVIKYKDGLKKVKDEIIAFQANNPMMYIQKKMELGGQDLGLVFLKGRYLGAYARVSKNNAWNTTINSGGSYASANPSDDIIALATKAQALFDMDFTTVDVAETESCAIVFEVSAFGGFRGAKEGIGINVAELYVEHVLQALKN